MNWTQSILILLLAGCFPSALSAQYIQVNDTYTAQQLVENVLVNSPCANVSNFTVNGDPFSPGEQSYGYFNGAGSTFPFSQGVVLSTSRAKRTEGPNTSLIDEGSTSWSGDLDLEQALGISNTYNATVLEFDFTPLTNSMSFDYIFASEEYQGNAPCRYSDGFAFLLKKAGTTDAYQNLALIPNTTIPVLVTSVHPNLPGCGAENETYFDTFNGSNAPINLNGQTVVLTAKSTVVPGVTYHIKLVIADHENIRYDSAIFLGGGTFKVGADLGPNRLASTNNAICQGERYRLNATQAGTNSYKWFKDGTQIPGEFSPTYEVTTPGTYSVEITLGTTTCIATGEVKIEFLPTPTLTNTTSIQCDEDLDGTTLFNLTRLNGIITNNDSTFGAVSYYENLSDAQNHDITLAITNPAAYSSTAKTIYASASNASGCFGVATVQLQISSHTSPFVKDYEICDLDSIIDGYYTFTLGDIDPKVLAGLPTGLLVNYYPTLNDAMLQTNPLPSSYTNVTQFIDRIYARIINGSDCYSIQAVDLYVNSNSPANFGDEFVYQCDNNPQTVTIANNFSSYLWSNGDTDNSTVFTASGDYTVTVSNSDGCLATKKFTVVNYNAPVIIGVQVEDFQNGNNNLFVNAIGNGNYEYSLDSVHFQTSPNFYNVRPGPYKVHVRDNNCGEDFYEIIVLDYPAYFTPNDDGYHDRWQIANIDILSGSRMRIFDRYGKLLKETKELEKGWDGTFNGNRLPADDYWFVLDLANGKTVRGHFSLKR